MFELQPGSWDETLTELANMLNCPDFKIWGGVRDKAKMYGLGFMVK